MTRKKKQFDVITIFPEVVEPYVQASILGRAQKAKLIDVRSYQLRDWATDKHHKVDDTPYGGGPGMVMKVDVFERAVEGVRAQRKTKGAKGRRVRVILTSASGRTFTQKDAKRLAKYDQLIFLCGRYEGVDHRVEEHVADETFSIGNYVLTGGELPALVMLDAIARLVPGVIEKESLVRESHGEEGYLEHPQYTKPPVYKKWKVPDVLLSGDHKKIEEWRKENRRP
ncbi:tRNA (guanosine(37)-N1)-methyltransferase TrmD [Candidatus Uhrbacteria bacterium]|nr:tRNA (guanosine(37)-N1)-methyltransferase TrmD [Candidatus Uhrbacteria bacterium]